MDFIDYYDCSKQRGGIVEVNNIATDKFKQLCSTDVVNMYLHMN